MIKTVLRTKQKLAEADLTALEARIGIALPDAYRAFLLQYNGGKPKPDYYQNKARHLARLRSFFYVTTIDDQNPGRKRDLNDLYRVLDVYQGSEERVPRDVLPIGNDEGGNLICLGIKGERRGAVYFWDHEQESDRGDDDDDDEAVKDLPETTLLLIQKSFEAFLDSFYVYEPDPLEEEFNTFFGSDRFDKLEAVFDAGFSPDYILPIYKMTALEYSAFYHQPKMIELLLRKGARKNMENALRLAQDRRNEQGAEIIRRYMEPTSSMLAILELQSDQK